MIDEVRRLLRPVAARYYALESRVLAGRMSRWSVRRRWVALVLVPLFVGCCGGLVGSPALWLLSATAEASRGKPSPVVAADAYLLALSYNEQDGLLPLLDDDAQADLLQQWHDLRAAMAATDDWGAPSVLGIIEMREGAISDGQATVEADVSATWWGKGGTPGTSIESKALTWRIETRDNDGWRVTRVVPPPWCGPHGYVARCPGDPVPSVAPSPTVSPSVDPKKDLREMLPCGPQDPFRNMPGRSRSCPPLSPS
jgi:hypothetical protein